MEILALSETLAEKMAFTLVATLAYKLVEVESEITGVTVTYLKACLWSAHCLTCMQRKRHRHLATDRASSKHRLCITNWLKG